MGSTPIYNWPFPENTDAPTGPAQIEALADAIEADVDAISDDVSSQGDLLDEFMPSALAAAPSATTSQTSYPFGLSIREATTALGYPTNGVLRTYRYSTSGRVAQQLTLASPNADIATRQYARHWGWTSSTAWSPWVETTNPTTELRHSSLEISTDVSVTGTTYAETDTLLRLTITAPPSGLATVIFGFNGLNDTANGEMFMSVDVRRVSDSSQLVTPDDNRIAYINQQSGTAINMAERTFLMTGMVAAAAYQIRGVYKVDAGTEGLWTRRWIAAIPSS